MMHGYRWFIVSALLAVVAAQGDIIWLENGKALEGTAENLGDRIRVIERDGKGEYELSTAVVARVDQGIWLEDLEPAARARAQRALQVPNIADPARTLPGEDTLRRRGISWKMFWPGSGKKINAPAYMTIVALVGFLFFYVLSFVAYIVVVIDAFRRSVITGLAVLLVPLVTLVYASVYYSGRRGRMFFALISPVLWLLIVWLVLIR